MDTFSVDMGQRGRFEFCPGDVPFCVDSEDGPVRVGTASIASDGQTSVTIDDDRARRHLTAATCNGLHGLWHIGPHAMPDGSIVVLMKAVRRTPA